jgi:F-type H+-transporting ATPase subunit epsilon
VAHEKLTAEVLTPEGELFSDEVEMLSTRTQVGSIGIMAHHQPLLASLDPTELRLYRSETDVVRFAQAEGYLQVTGDHALVLVEEAHPPEALDAADLERRLRDAQRAAEQAQEGTEERERAQRDAKRAQAFLEVARGS